MPAGPQGFFDPAVELVDIDGDGDLDVVTSHATVLVNDGFGVFTDESTSRMPNPGFVFGAVLASADMDGDGDVDVALQSGLMRNDGNGVFQLEVAGLTLGYGDTLSCGDFDGDGDHDLLTAAGALFRNTGLGVFDLEVLAHALPLAAHSGGFKMADLDGDGALDLIVVNEFGTSSSLWFRNDSAAGFRTSSRLPFEHNQIIDVHAADLDQDGDIDLVGISNHGDNPVPPQPLYNDGSGGFTSGTDLGPAGDLYYYFFGYPLDLGGDGLPDIAWATVYESRMLHNDGTGRLVPGAVLPRFSPNKTVVPLAHGDFDGDGDIDLLVTNDDNNGAVKLLVNDGAAGFSLTGGWTVPSAAGNQGAIFSAQAGDVDGDGDLDVVTTGADVRLWVNDGAARFQHRVLYTPGANWITRSAVLADLDRDGDLDVALVENHSLNHFRAAVGYLRNDGARFATVPFANAPWQVRDLHVVDLDGDGALDVVADAGGSWHSVAYTNDGRGGFAPSGWNLPLAQLTFADIDLDGRADLVVNGAWPEVLLGDGTGAFVPTAPLSALGFPARGSSFGVRALDIDGDGDRDLIQYGDNTSRNRREAFLYWNALRDLRVPGITQSGGSLDVTVTSAGAANDPGRLALVWIGFAETPVTVPGVGALRVDPTQGLPMDVAYFAGADTCDTSIAVPTNPVFKGIEIVLQGAIFRSNGSVEATGIVRETIGR